MKTHFKLIEEQEHYAMVEYATKDSGGCIFLDKSDPKDYLQHFKLKKLWENKNEWEDFARCRAHTTDDRVILQ